MRRVGTQRRLIIIPGGIVLSYLQVMCKETVAESSFICNHPTLYARIHMQITHARTHKHSGDSNRQIGPKLELFRFKPKVLAVECLRFLNDWHFAMHFLSTECQLQPNASGPLPVLIFFYPYRILYWSVGSLKNCTCVRNPPMCKINCSKPTMPEHFK